MKNSVSTKHINIARHLRTLIERDDVKNKQRLACTTALTALCEQTQVLFQFIFVLVSFGFVAKFTNYQE